MSLYKPIGGYFEIELRRTGSLFQDAILLNSGRNCFEYVLRAQQVKKVYMPVFTCDVMLEPVKRLGINYEFYRIDQNLEIIDKPHLAEDEYIVYTNYFGIKDQYCKELSTTFDNKLILDCSQALYFNNKYAKHVFYSPRKFIGLPDGGCLYTEKRLNTKFEIGFSYDRMTHLFKRIDLGPEAGYEDFKKNDASLSGEPIREMSKITRALLGSFDYQVALGIRNKNFNVLHKHLESSNKLSIDTYTLNGPMAYPYLVKDESLRKKLIDNKIFVATYWPNVFEWTDEGDLERDLAAAIIPLPIDQRYGDEEMTRIIEIIL